MHDLQLAVDIPHGPALRVTAPQSGKNGRSFTKNCGVPASSRTHDVTGEVHPGISAARVSDSTPFGYGRPSPAFPQKPGIVNPYSYRPELK